MKGAVMKSGKWKCFCTYTSVSYRVISVFLALIFAAGGVLLSMISVYALIGLAPAVLLLMGLADFWGVDGGGAALRERMDFIRSSAYGKEYVNSVLVTDLVLKLCVSLTGFAAGIVVGGISPASVFLLGSAGITVGTLMWFTGITREKAVQINVQMMLLYLGALVASVIDLSWLELLKFADGTYAFVPFSVLWIAGSTAYAYWACRRLYRRQKEAFESGYMR